MKKLTALLSLVAVLASCSKEEDINYKNIVTNDANAVFNVGESHNLSISYLDDAGQKKAYDMKSDPLKLAYCSSDESVLKVDAKGNAECLSQGYAVVTIASTAKQSLKCQCKLTVVKPGMYDLSRTFSDDMAYHCYAKAGFDRQSFDIDSKGNVYSAFSKSNGSRGYLGIMKHTLSGTDSEEMKFYYASHGDSFSIEEAGNDTYLWVPTFGSKASDGTYGSSQMFCRVKFEPGKAYTPEELASCCFYDKAAKDVFISRDKMTGNIAVMFAESYNGYSHRVKIFKAQDLLDAPMKTVSTASMKRGGDFGPITSEKTETVSVKVHDITGITPLADFRYRKAEVYGKINGSSSGRVFQGFCYYGGACYFACDGGNDNRTEAKRDMVLSKVSLTGKILEGPTHIKAADATAAIRAKGFCSSQNYLETEGILLKDDALYLGALSWNSGGSCFNATFKLK